MTTSPTDRQRVSTVVQALVDAVRGVIRDHEITYPEFRTAQQWLMDLGEGGEWPLFLDVFVEHEVEKVAERTQHGTKGTIEGPYHLPGQKRLPATATLPQRDDEKGDTLILTGQVRALDGTPLGGAEVDIWQADADGYYSGFAPHIPDGNLRGVITTDEQGRFEITTVRPAPYRIPTDGPTGALLTAAGWHPWRPAHLHLMVGATGYRQITTQLYFQGGDWLDSDVASATKDELILAPVRLGNDLLRARYDFDLEPL
ncbi:dioxygenase family protein [Nocardia terpenica]|uniref:Catechol 1,2-dioxygenase n=1 Tax=Nocardia terpenica TaxID=455432 RepID=A0A291RLS1_9NOCA|nr:dioxygenase [Nocardia terpenica]ATL68248.1 catechol 1,2-dioxygenase [Nocardia terpenica]